MTGELTFDFFEDDLPEEHLSHYRRMGILAIDTETMGLNHHRDRLCLVQLGDGQGGIQLVRPTTGQTPNLNALLADENVVKVFHFARFDVAALYNGLGVMTQNIFCTKIASKLARTYTDRHGLKDVTFDMLGIQLDKTSQTTDWGTKELTEAQLRYAASDVLHLIELKNRLAHLLEREGRTALAQSCFNFIQTQALIDLGGWEKVLDH